MRHVALLVVLCLACGVVEAQGFGELEGRVVKPLAPDLSLEFGGGISVELGLLPPDWPVIAERRVFVDALLVGGQVALGMSLSLRGARQDDGLRLGGAIYRSEGFEWSLYLARAVEFRW